MVEESRNVIAQHPNKTPQIAYSPVAAITMVEISRIAHLVIAFPLLLPIAFCPAFIAKKNMLIHQCLEHIEQLEAS